MIDTLEEIRASSSDIGLAYVYCDYQEQDQQTAENITGAILKQLLMQLRSIPEKITAFWQRQHEEGKTLELLS